MSEYQDDPDKNGSSPQPQENDHGGMDENNDAKSQHGSRDHERSSSRSRERDREKGREKDRDGEREKDRDKERSRDRDRDRDKDRDRDRERDKDRSRDRDRDRDRDRHRDRHRDRSDRSDRHRDRDIDDDYYKSRDRDRRRDYDRDRDDRHKHRSRSRGRSEHRSRSRSRSRSKSKRISGFDMAPPSSAMLTTAAAFTGQIPGSAPTIPGMFPNMLQLTQGQSLGALPIMPMQAMTQQATRHARRVYVGGLPPSANEQSVATFFSHVMAAIGGNTAGPGDAVVNVYINHEKKFAFVEMRSVEEASNAMALDGIIFVGPDPASWTPPRTERDGFWEPVVSGSESETLKFGSLSSSFKEADATVCAGGGCKYEKLQDAVDGAPENLEGGKKYVIKIKEGVYDEIVRVPFNKKNLVFLGDGMGKTVITGSLSTGIQGITTYNTATVGVLGDGFMASGLTIQNTAGPDAHQAVAFRSDSDFSYVENCEFLGNQDTIYVHALRQLFKSCRIEGNVDFIFGNAAAIFQDCTILVRPRQLKPASGETNAISAHGRTDPAQTTGFAFLGCQINGTEEYMKLYHSKPSKHKNYLGRPWKMYSRTVYINSTMEALITPAGWLPWSGDFALSTLYYGEVGNTGPGADLSNRVPWSRQIPGEHISTFSVQNFLQGDEWITTAS